MSKKVKTYHQNLLFAYREVDVFDWGDSGTQSPWYDTEAEMEAALEIYKQKTNYDPNSFTHFRIVTKPKEEQQAS